MKDDVSVIVPFFNGNRYVGETVASILNQTRKPREILIVDDCSPSPLGPHEWIDDPRVRVIRHDVNRGVCAARNTGIAAASGRLIAFSDQDDVWLPEKLERQTAFLESHAATDFVFTDFKYLIDGRVSEAGKFSEAPLDFWSRMSPIEGGQAYIFEADALLSLLEFQPVFPSTVIVKRQFIEQVGGFVESLGREPSEDLEFLFRCVGSGAVAALCEPLVAVRKHAQNYSGDFLSTVLSQIRILRLAVQSGRYAAFDVALNAQIRHRSKIAFDWAFSEGRFDVCRQARPDIDADAIDLKLAIKTLVLMLPDQALRRLYRLATGRI